MTTPSNPNPPNPFTPVAITATIEVGQDELDDPGSKDRVLTKLALALGKKALLELQPQVRRSLPDDNHKIQFSVSCVLFTPEGFAELGKALEQLGLEESEDITVDQTQH